MIGGYIDKNITWTGNFENYGENNDKTINAIFDGTIIRDGPGVGIIKKGTWEILNKNEKEIEANFTEFGKIKKLNYKWTNGNWEKNKKGELEYTGNVFQPDAKYLETIDNPEKRESERKCIEEEKKQYMKERI